MIEGVAYEQAKARCRYASQESPTKPKNEFSDGRHTINGAGTFKFANELSVSSDNATIQGAGMDQTILDFTNQGAGAEGILGIVSPGTI